MTDDSTEAAVDRFLRDVERVYREYDRGYVDADVALDRIRGHVDDLDDVVED